MDFYIQSPYKTRCSIRRMDTINELAKLFKKLPFWLRALARQSHWTTLTWNSPTLSSKVQIYW